MSSAHLTDAWGHVINPTPGQRRRAALRLIEQAIDVGADLSEVRDALEAIGLLRYDSGREVRLR